MKGSSLTSSFKSIRIDSNLVAKFTPHLDSNLTYDINSSLNSSHVKELFKVDSYFSHVESFKYPIDLLTASLIPDSLVN